MTKFTQSIIHVVDPAPSINVRPGSIRDRHFKLMAQADGKTVAEFYALTEADADIPGRASKKTISRSVDAGQITLEAPKTVVMVLTAKSAEELRQIGGSGDWRLNPKIVAVTDFVVCCRNVFHEGSRHTTNHGEGFLIAKIKGLKPSVESPGRLVIQFKEVAEIAMDKLWTGDRNPVRYTTLADLEIDLRSLDFQPLSEVREPVVAKNLKAIDEKEPSGLTIAEAKKGLATTFSVDENAVEITIRG